CLRDRGVAFCANHGKKMLDLDICISALLDTYLTLHNHTKSGTIDSLGNCATSFPTCRGGS
ncbi:hypothetical protein A2U01_0018996, partial [Trifolium medium]|nr:hypothetical protein [Trifolium medium]